MKSTTTIQVGSALVRLHAVLYQVTGEEEQGPWAAASGWVTYLTVNATLEMGDSLPRTALPCCSFVHALGLSTAPS